MNLVAKTISVNIK